jgi:hypothetical protein
MSMFALAAQRRRNATSEIPLQRSRFLSELGQTRKEGDPALSDDPLTECMQVSRSVRSKADANKQKARVLAWTMSVSTVAIPVFIGLSGDSFVFGKVVPSALAGLTAFLVAFGQLERPHERWALYRRYQRKFEAEAKRYKYSVAPYDDDDRDRTLGMLVAQLELDLQTEWEGLIPRSDEVANMTKKGTQQ